MIPLKNFSLATDKGPYLHTNGDTVDANPENGLYLLIDGIGGGQRGAKATELIKETIKNTYANIAEDSEATLPFYYTAKYMIETNAVVNAAYQAHAAILEDNGDKKTDDMAGGSSVIVCQAGSILGIVSTGNCRAYLLREGSLKNLIEPDILADLSFDGTQDHLYTAPTSGFGLFEDIHLTIREYRIRRGDSVVLLSDGVYGRIGEDDILSTVGGAQNGGEAIREMFQLANLRGNLDNQSCLILSY